MTADRDGEQNVVGAGSAPSNRPVPDLGRGTLRGRPFRWARFGLLLLLKPLLHLRIEGVRNVPSSGPVMVVSNHLHNADPIVLSIVLPRPVHFMAKKETFANPIISAIIRRVGAFPIDRGKADRGAIKRAEQTLDQGIPVLMFPEGTRSRSLVLQPAHRGAALIAQRRDVPIVPIAITGTERLPFNGNPASTSDSSASTGQPARGIVVRIGPPFRLPQSTENARLTTQAATTQMMLKIAELLPPSYRGHYAETNRTGSNTVAPPPPTATDHGNW